MLIKWEWNFTKHAQIHAVSHTCQCVTGATPNQSLSRRRHNTQRGKRKERERGRDREYEGQQQTKEQQERRFSYLSKNTGYRQRL